MHLALALRRRLLAGPELCGWYYAHWPHSLCLCRRHGPSSSPSADLETEGRLNLLWHHARLRHHTALAHHSRLNHAGTWGRWLSVDHLMLLNLWAWRLRQHWPPWTSWPADHGRH